MDINKYVDYLDTFIKDYNGKTMSNQIDESHGITHMTMVLKHATEALNNWTGRPIDEKEIFKVRLAALLHDIDDSKYFDNNHYENAKYILDQVDKDSNILSEKDKNDIIQMIEWVSSSKNGDRIPPEAVGKEYLLYPRYADRLEALGIIGLERTLHYTLNKAQKEGKYDNKNNIFLTEYPETLFIKKGDVLVDTKRATDLEDLYNNIATLERYQSYSKGSKSMMDHFYDKLLRLGKYPIDNVYFNAETQKRQGPLEDIALEFGRNPDMTERELKALMESKISHVGGKRIKRVDKTRVNKKRTNKKRNNKRRTNKKRNNKNK